MGKFIGIFHDHPVVINQLELIIREGGMEVLRLPDSGPVTKPHPAPSPHLILWGSFSKKQHEDLARLRMEFPGVPILWLQSEAINSANAAWPPADDFVEWPCSAESLLSRLWFNLARFNADSPTSTASTIPAPEKAPSPGSDLFTLGQEVDTLQNLVNAIPEVAFVLDTNFNLIALNQAFANWTGIPAQELIGKSAPDLLPSDLAQERLAKTQEVIQTGCPLQFEDSHDNRTFHNFLNPGFDEKGKVRYVAVYAIDITGQRRAEGAFRESENRFRSITRQLTEWVVQLNTEGIIEYCNSRVESLFGLNPSQVIGQPFNLLLAEMSVETATQLVRELTNNPSSTVEAELEFLGPEKEIFVGHVRGSCVENSGQPAILFSIRDVTERKQSVEALQAMNQGLFLLSRSATMLAELSRSDEVYQIIPKQLRALTQAELVLFGVVRPDQTMPGLTLVSLTPDLDVKRGEKLESRGPVGKFIPLDPAYLAKLARQPIQQVPDLSPFSLETFFDDRDQFAPRLAGINRFQVLAFFLKNDFLGMAFAGFSPAVANPPPEILKSFVHLVAVTLGRLGAEDELRLSEIRFREIFENAQDVFVESTLEGKLIEISPSIEAFSKGKLKREEMIGKSLLPYYTNPEQRKEWVTQLAKKGYVIDHEIDFLNRDGKVISCSLSSRLHPGENGRESRIFSSLRDITIRKENELHILQISRLNALIRQVNQAMVCLRDKDNLLKEVCRIMIDSGGFRFVWIGFFDEKSRSVYVHSSHGFDQGYSEFINRINLENQAERSGPTAQSFLTGSRVVCRDFETDPAVEKWRQRALGNGYRSSISLPIRNFGNVIGSLNIYSSQPNYFEDQEIGLLTEVSDNLSFALEALEVERLHRESMAFLQASEEKFATAFMSSPVLITISDSETHRFVEVNETTLRVSGFSREELIGRTSPEIGWIANEERQALLSSKGGGPHEATLIRKDGSTRILSFDTRVIHFQGRAHLLTQAVDITEQKLARERLLESEYFFRETQNAGKIGSYKADFIADRWESSEVLDTIFGIDPGFSRNVATWISIIHPEDRERMAVYLEDQVIQGKQPFDMEYRISRVSDGETRWVLGRGQLILTAEGQVRGLLGTIQDITDRKSIEENIRRSEEQYRLLAENSLDVIWTIDMKGRFTYVSPSVKKLLGYAPEEILRMNPAEWLTERTSALMTRKLHYSLILSESGRQDSEFQLLEYEQYRKDGSRVHTESMVIPIYEENGSIRGFLGTTRDITERKKIQEELRASEELFRGIYNESPIAIELYDQEGQLLDVNPAGLKMFGIDSVEWVRGFNLFDDPNIPPDQLGLLKKGQEVRYLTRFDFELVRKLNLYPTVHQGAVYLDVLISPSVKSGQLPFSFLVQVQDVTNILSTQAQLQESEEKHRLMVDLSPDGVMVIQDQSIIFCNPASLRILGAQNIDEILSKKYLDFVHPLFQEKSVERFRQIANNVKVGYDRMVLSKLNGELFDAEVVGAKIQFGGQSAIQIILRDVSEQIHAEKALRESMELNESLLNTIPFGMNIVDENRNSLFMSHNMKSLFPGDDAGCPCLTGLNEGKEVCTNCPVLQGIPVGKTGSFETDELVDGRFFEVIYTGMVYKGQPAMLEIFNDITEKKQVEKKVKMLAHSLESISECISITDTKDQLIYVNDSFLRIYGYSREELIGNSTLILRPENANQPGLEEIIPATLDGGWIGELLNRKKDGTVFPILLSTSVLRDAKGEPSAMIGVAMDITEMKKSRDELMAAKEKALESDRLKSNFLANMSHEIRTPMNAILGFSSFLEDETLASEERRSYIQIIREQGNHLLTILNDILDISRIQGNQLTIHKSPFNLNQLLHSQALTFEVRKAQMEKEALALRFEKGLEDFEANLLADRERLTQVLNNLLSNALKFTKEGEVVFGYRQEGNELVFYVRDTGKGIASDKLQVIFEQFRQEEESITRFFGGTGLGLSISRGLVELMGGRIWVTSTPGVGSTFYFTLPASCLVIQPKPHTSEPPPVQNLNFSGKTILVAEDVLENYELVRIILRRLNPVLLRAENGQKAVDICRENPDIDLILMDIGMPILDGYQATRLIRTFHPHLPIIALTAHAQAEEKVRCIQEGCTDYLSKPLNQKEMIHKIHHYLFEFSEPDQSIPGQ